jgi:hypothetical protein
MMLIVCLLQLFLVECRQTIVGACCWLLALSDGPLLSARALPIEWSGPREQLLCRFPLISPIYDDICILVVGLNTIWQLVDFLNGHVFNTEAEGFFHHSHRLTQEVPGVDDSGLVHEYSTLGVRIFSRRTNGRASHSHRGEANYVR